MKRLNRRQFLGRTSAAGAALTLPWHLLGCDDSTEPAPPASRHFHFDLSNAHADESYTLNAQGKRYQLAKHTDDTRTKLLPADSAVDSSRVTHYVQDVTLPAEYPIFCWVTGTTDIVKRGPYSFISSFIHIAEQAEQRASQLRSMLGHPAPISSRKSALNDGSCQDFFPNSQWQFTDAFDSATSIVFHHPEVMKLDADTSAYIKPLIEASQDTCFLANLIFSQGPAYLEGTGTSGWCELVPLLGEDGKALTDGQGNPLHDHRFSDTTNQYLIPAVKSILTAIKDDTNLKHKSWSVQPGLTAIAPTEGSSSNASAKEISEKRSELTSGYSLALSHAQGTTSAGLEYVSLKNESSGSKRSFAFVVKNNYLRYLTVYVEFLDVDGKAVKPTGWESRLPSVLDSTFGLETDTRKYLGLVGPPAVLLGVRIYSSSLTFRVDMPEGATRCKLLFGGLGSGSHHDLTVEKAGILLTCLVQYAIPSLFLAIGDGETSDSSLKKQIYGDGALWVDVLITLKDAINWNEEALHADAKSILINLANLVGSYLLKAGMAAIWQLVVAAMGKEEALSSIPFAGWALRAFNAAVTLSEIAETTVDVCSSPWVIENEVRYAMDVKVTVNAAENDTVLPQTADKWRVITMFSDNTFADSLLMNMPTEPTPSLTHTFEGVPTGGTVNVIASFISDSNWLAGRGETGEVNALVSKDKTVLDQSITITESKLRINADTTYKHREKLTAHEGVHTWKKESAPTATKNDADCGAGANKLCDLHSITVSELTGMLGYAWQGSSSEAIECGTGDTGSQFNFVQNVNLTTPDTALKTSCGFDAPAPMVYQLMGPAKDSPQRGNGLNFYVDPADGANHLRRVVLDDSAGSLPLPNESWGRFSESVDALVIHPGRRAIAINYEHHKLMVLRLPTQATSDADAALAQLYSGPGTREGLIKSPVALGVAADGRILVLESGNQRVQAFDIHGNAVKCFGNNESSFMALHSETSAATYVDMAVESEGYIYVLSFINGGATAADYRLDIYDRQGTWVTRTTHLAAGRITVDYWRVVYALNWESIVGPNGRTEPSLSIWEPENS